MASSGCIVFNVSEMREARDSACVLRTARLELVPITLAHVEAVFLGERADFERIILAHVPPAWPNRAIVERAFSASLEDIRADPGGRLWGNRLIIAHDEDESRPRLVGSVIFHGRPGEEGIVEIGYGVEDDSQGRGYATEAVSACVTWALSQPMVEIVEATTFPWHRASLRVIEKVGMKRIRVREHDMLGEMWVFARWRQSAKEHVEPGRSSGFLRGAVSTPEDRAALPK